jgi:S-formylglutathione hydrolase FrmB
MPLCELHYRSEALQKQTAATILLPAATVPGPYHVMFLLHGLSDDQSAWTRYTSIERYMSGLPIIVVMPDGGRGFYADAERGYAFATAIGVELPELIRHYFPTKEGWCSTGLSMGGYGAAKLALTHPELFVSGHSHSGAVGFGHQLQYLESERREEFLRILGENPIGGPNDLFALAEKIDPSKRPKLRIDCGTEDYLLLDNQLFSAYLTEIGFDHEYEEFPGDHSWGYWDLHVQEAIAFHCKNLGIQIPA